MSIKYYPNNDPKQCTVSKLGRVYSAHTQVPACAHSAVSRALGAVSQRHVARTGPYRSAMSRVVALCRSVVSLPPIATQNCVTIQSHVARASPYHNAVSRTATARPYALARSCAWPCTPRPCLSPYNTMYRDQDWKMGIAHPSFLCTFLFSFIFFSFVRLIGKPQKKILLLLFFISSSRTSENYLFIYIFFPVLHTVKPT